MRGLLRLTLAAFVLTLVAGAFAVLVAQQPVVRYVVILAAEADTATALPAVKRWGLTVVGREGAVLTLKGRPLLLDSLKALRPAPLYAEYDQTTTLDPDSSGAALLEVSEPLALPWNLAMIRADSAWGRGITGAGVVVGILDTGVDGSHPDLSVVGGKVFVSSGDTTSWGDLPGCNGHGTHVAGTVASTRHGVAPGARILAVRVFELSNGSCISWGGNQVLGYAWLRAQGVRLANASIGGSWTGYAAAGLATWVANGGLLAASSGNASGSLAVCPACYPGVLSVGALTSSGARASYSNTDPDLDLTAPGTGIVSTLPGGGTGSKSGTSMASPHVAGVAALLEQLRPGLSPDSMTKLLHASAVDLGAPGLDPSFGRGRVDVQRLLALVIPPAPLVPSRATGRVGETRCVPVSGAAGPWTASTSADGLQVWTTPQNELCWRGDAPGTFTIRTRSL